ncbi:long-chain-fatty-acid--CoA ligase [Corynebacterium resistens]|uniref:long-chain-fatty-acid--CoA ligase n=1 Tax=Corynebacterium resistens TaxID=258224 RepID=UPI002352D8B5|nr:long-chain-fatty-acid--CoA ligase [Corynebacterium resistens]
MNSSQNSSQSTASQAFNRKAWLEHYTEGTAPDIEGLNDRGETLVEVFWKALSEFGDRRAFTFFGKETSYEEYGVEVKKAAGALQKLGVKRGEHVAIVLPNCPQALVAFYAVLSVGAVPVLHNPLYTTAELEHPFNDHAARVAIAWNKTGETMEKLKQRTPLETVVTVDMLQAMPKLKRLALKLPIGPLKAAREKLSSPAPSATPWEEFLASGKRFARSFTPVSVDAQEPALVLYTSGTTGKPKGAVLSHGNLVSNLVMGVTWVQDLGKGEKPEVMLAALPIFHAYGLTMNITLAPFTGSELVLLPAPEMALVMQVIKKHHPTWLPGVPTLYEKIMDTAEEKGVSLKGIRNSFSGASALPAATVRRWEELTGGAIVEGYGLTETSPIILGNPLGKGREGYIGVPFPSTEVRIADPENPAETLEDGEAGELLVRGPQVFKGYLNRPDATAESFEGDWFRTGDMAVMEADGYVRIASRIKEMIITGGFNVYPAEVEAALEEHEDIEQACVVGLPRSDGSETVVAALVLADGARVDAKAFRSFAKEHLTSYKVPRAFYAFEELPADQMGKIRRREVKELVEKVAQN